MKKLNAQGFTAVEGLLVVVLLAIVGFTGYYVYHAQHNTNKSLDAANKSAATQSTATASSTKTNKTTDTNSAAKYLDVKEWGVKFPYSGSDTLSYKFSSDAHIAVEVISKDLASSYIGCDKLGSGTIVRGKANDKYTDGTSPAQAYAQNPTMFGKIGDYYYFFYHDEAACADSPTSASAEAENAANDFVKAIVPKVTAD